MSPESQNMVKQSLEPPTHPLSTPTHAPSIRSIRHAPHSHHHATTQLLFRKSPQLEPTWWLIGQYHPWAVPHTRGSLPTHRTVPLTRLIQHNAAAAVLQFEVAEVNYACV